MIPCVSQIFLTDDDRQELPPLLQRAVEGVRLAFPTCRHTIYDSRTMRAFIAEHYEADVLEAYDALRPYSYKADLGKYCLLNVNGGWYFDIAVRPLLGITLSEAVEFLAFRDIQRHSLTSWSCSAAVLYARPKIKVLRTAIEFVVRNRKEDYYGITPLCPTGPTLLGEAIAVNRANPRHVFGDFLELTPMHPEKNMAFVLPDGRILAFGKRGHGGDLSTLGVRGGNNYNELWKARQIYRPPG